MKDQRQVKEEMKQELERVKYRTEILDLIEEKLFKMRALAQRVVDEDLSDEETEEMNQQVQFLDQEIKLLNSESNGMV